MSLNPCGARSARPTNVSFGDNHATTESFLDRTKSEKLAHLEVKDRAIKVAIRIKSEPDRPGFKLTSNTILFYYSPEESRTWDFILIIDLARGILFSKWI